MKKAMLITILLLLPLCLAQDAQVLLQHYGFGENPNEAKFTIHSSGDIPISDISIYIDGELYERKESLTLPPKKGISITLILQPGEHLVEVRTAEGAYDSEIVVVSSVQNKEFQPKEVLSFAKSNTFKAVALFVLISAVILWVLAKRPKLDF